MGPVDMSLSGAFLILIVLILRALLIEKLPKRLFPAMWAVCMVRLLAPASFAVPVLRHMPRQGTSGVQFARAFDAAAGESGLPAAITGYIPPADGHTSVPVLAIIWASVGLAMAAYFIVSYIRFRREFRASLPVENAFAARWTRENGLRRRVELRSLHGIPSPMTYGVLRPVVLMPRNFDWSDERRAEFVLAH